MAAISHLNVGEILHTWERLLWDGRPRRFGARLSATRYVLTDLRLVRASRTDVHELPIHDIADVNRIETPLDLVFGTSTLVVDAKDRTVPSLVLPGVQRGAQVAALIEWLAAQPRGAEVNADALHAAVDWEPLRPSHGGRRILIAGAGIAAALYAAAIALHGSPRPIRYSALDPIAPNGTRRPRAEIVRFMEAEVMPWARAALGPIKGGPERITCETCHGRDPGSRDWQMPAVTALPAPILRDLGWERYNGSMDAQVRNAIYGYLAESEKQSKAAYMREVIVPGMARLLERPAYDFTQSYEFNRARNAIGCYHCHLVSGPSAFSR
jgi:hypothetical protein